MIRCCYLLLFATCIFFACGSPVPSRVLIFSKTSPHGYRHVSIESGKNALVDLCYQNGIWADTTENSAHFNEKNLKKYAAVIFLSTNGEVLDADQEAAFERYIQAGGGFVGIHAASATEYTWRWYGGLLGAYFKDHPPIQDGSVQVERCNDPSTAHLGCSDWAWTEEWYNFRQYEPDLEILLSIDERKYKGGSLPNGQFDKAHHPLAWQHTYDGGRSFYTSLGHTPEAYSDPAFRQHLLGGIRYAIGEQKPLNYRLARSLPRPDQTRFVKTVVADHLNEPMELDQLPDGKILLVERHGYLRLFDPATSRLSVVAKLPVYSEMGDGLMGIAVDPDWERNHRIFLYYSSLLDSMNQLSQFIFYDDTLHRSSEKTILRVPTGRLNCFHAAGSLAFGPDGYLYLATGDNTSPFASEGFAPMDEQPGRKSFDAQRSSGNTMDLRGKILRIRVADDGTYTWPPDNLFVENKKGRPEIFIMGCRNPFRISIDQRRNWLYWGDIGPDAGKSDTLRGPMGHDEINQARKAGNYGWPYFTGNNQPYRAYDYAQKKSGAWFDPQHPVNRSPNNTGATELPPAQTAFIWYPYGRNRDFPMLGEGGRNAMAGPTYYCDQYAEKTRFPDYYNGKTIIYDWMRNWLMAVSVDSSGYFHHLEPMADSVKMMRPMDMIVDRKTGSIWLLEYGQRWYASNEEACLSRIDYVRGNRKPIARIEADKTAGSVPLTVRFNAGKSEDYDQDACTYEYRCNNMVYTQRTRPDTFPWRFEQAGIYDVVLKITDAQGAWSTDTLRIFAGNEPPSVQFDLQGHNRSFYQPGETLHYHILVADREDGSLQEKRIPAEQVQMAIEYVEKSVNPGKLPQKAEERSEPYVKGKTLIAASDCYSCHALEREVNGPSFQAVASRYRSNPDFAVQAVYRKIIYGGSGNWGQRSMSAHPNIREEDAIEMARWILALGDPPKPKQALPLSGTYPLTADQGAYLLQAAYRDRGKNGLPSLPAEAVVVLRPAVFQVERCDERSRGVGNYKPFNNDTTTLNELKHNAWFAINQVDLQGITSLTLRLGSGDSRNAYCGGRLEIHRDKPGGPLLASLDIPRSNEKEMRFREEDILFSGNLPAGYSDLYFVFKNEVNQGQGVVGLDWIRFNVGMRNVE